MSMCRVFSCGVGRECLLWPVCFLGKTLFALPCFILYSKAKFPCYSRYLFPSYFCIPVPYNEKGIFFGVLILKYLVGLLRTIQLQFFQHYWSGHSLGLPWYWMVCLVSKQIILSFLRLYPSRTFQTLVDDDGYSISSKGFLPTVVDIMVIWVKFTHSSPF